MCPWRVFTADAVSDEKLASPRQTEKRGFVSPKNLKQTIDPSNASSPEIDRFERIQV